MKLTRKVYADLEVWIDNELQLVTISGTYVPGNRGTRLDPPYDSDIEGFMAFDPEGREVFLTTSDIERGYDALTIEAEADGFYDEEDEEDEVDGGCLQ